MSQEPDKREHSPKPEVDDLTDYQSLNSLGGAGVAGSAKETSTSSGPDEKKPDEKAADSNNSEQPTGVEEGGNYNDGADFITVDNEGLTNA